MNKRYATEFIKKTAARLGFDYCGIAAAEKLDEDGRRLEAWLNKGFHGSMRYMENHFEMRIDPTLLVPGAKSVITFLMNYFPEERQQHDTPKISKYAWGKDYHNIIRKKLHEMLDEISTHIGEVNGRGFVDSAPVLERSWAHKAGLGWIGKNGNLINKQQGSYFFIANLIIDLELEYDLPGAKDYCGTCTRCIDACPTEAILPDKVIDGSRCVSYYTIELKDAVIDKNMQGKFDNWLFGCDACQDVCPWNRFSRPTREEGFKPLFEILNFRERDWEELTEENFKMIFKDSPLKRASFKGIRRNLHFIKKASDE